MNFEMITSGKCCITLTAVIFFISSMKFYMAVSASLVLKQSTTICALKRKFVTVALLMVF